MQTVVSSSTFGRGSLSPTSIRPFDECANGSNTEESLGALDDFRNWLQLGPEPEAYRYDDRWR